MIIMSLNYKAALAGKDGKYTEENLLFILTCKTHLLKLRLPRMLGIRLQA